MTRDPRRRDRSSGRARMPRTNEAKRVRRAVAAALATTTAATPRRARPLPASATTATRDAIARQREQHPQRRATTRPHRAAWRWIRLGSRAVRALAPPSRKLARTPRAATRRATATRAARDWSELDRACANRAQPKSPTLARQRAKPRRGCPDCRLAAQPAGTQHQPTDSESSRATLRPVARGLAPADCDQALWTRSPPGVATASGPMRSASTRTADPVPARGRRAPRIRARHPADSRQARLRKKPTCDASCSISRRSPTRTELAPPQDRDRARVAIPREGRESELRRATRQSVREPRRRRRAAR